MDFSDEAFPIYNTSFRAVILVFGLLGIVFSILTTASCQYFDFKVEGDGTPSSAFLNDVEASGSIGMFSFYSGEANDCVDYPNDFDADKSMKIARTAIVFATLAGGTALIYAFIESTCFAFDGNWKFLGAGFFVAAILGQVSSFSILATQDICANAECSFGTGGIYSVVAFAMYVIGSFLACLSPPTAPMIRKAKREAEEQFSYDESDALKQQQEDPESKLTEEEPVTSSSEEEKVGTSSSEEGKPTADAYGEDKPITSSTDEENQNTSSADGKELTATSVEEQKPTIANADLESGNLEAEENSIASNVDEESGGQETRSNHCHCVEQVQIVHVTQGDTT